MDVARPSLDQLAVFVAVVETGSFNAAARRLGRAVSAVSYAIGTLEAQLGVILFERQGSRRPVLTEAGRAILGPARGVAGQVDDLVAGVRALNRGLESELTLAVDVMVPLGLLAGVLREFQAAFPTVDLRLHVERLGATLELVVSHRAQVGIVGQALADHPACDQRLLGEIELVPVAAPGHALARLAQIPAGMARRYRQLVLTDGSQLSAGQDFGVLATRSWRLGDLGAKHALLREGIGWGNMPRHMVERDLADGRLVHLALPEGRHTPYALRATWRRDDPPGPAQCWLVERLGEGFAAFAATESGVSHKQ